MLTRSLPTGVLILCAAFLDNPPGSLLRAASGFISVLSGGALAASIVVTFYILTVFTKRDSGPRAILQGFSALLSGQLVPLAFWPASLTWVSHQPFAYVADQPARVFIGSAAMTSVVITQMLWTAFFCLIGSIAAERHFRLREAVGA
ncbi:ABC-2 family transporter protein [Austwickia chelonae]|uniref:ABC-2 family transporter protein n=1 Tax=Austwickia chelonae TaxID=100225 RepID=UPI000941E5A9